MSHPLLQLVAVLTLLAVSPAQQAKASQDELLAQKLQSPFLGKAPWLTDWHAACTAAAARQQLIFGYFTTVNY